jgi:hypothetical protein
MPFIVSSTSRRSARARPAERRELGHGAHRLQPQLPEAGHRAEHRDVAEPADPPKVKLLNVRQLGEQGQVVRAAQMKVERAKAGHRHQWGQARELLDATEPSDRPGIPRRADEPQGAQPPTLGHRKDRDATQGRVAHGQLLERAGHVPQAVPALKAEVRDHQPAEAGEVAQRLEIRTASHR